MLIAQSKIPTIDTIAVKTLNMHTAGLHRLSSPANCQADNACSRVQQRWPRWKSARGLLATGKALAEIGQSHHAGHLNLLLLASPRFGVRTKGQPFACPGLVAIHFCSPAVFGRVRLKIKEAPVVHCCLGDATM